MSIYKFRVQQKTEKSDNNANKRKATDILRPLNMQILSNVFLILTVDNILNAYYLPDSTLTRTQNPME